MTGKHEVMIEEHIGWVATLLFAVLAWIWARVQGLVGRVNTNEINIVRLAERQDASAATVGELKESIRRLEEHTSKGFQGVHERLDKVISSRQSSQ